MSKKKDFKPIKVAVFTDRIEAELTSMGEYAKFLQGLKEPYEALHMGAFDTEALHDLASGGELLKERYKKSVGQEQSKFASASLRKVIENDLKEFSNNKVFRYLSTAPTMMQEYEKEYYEVQNGKVTITEQARQRVEEENTNYITTEQGAHLYTELKRISEELTALIGNNLPTPFHRLFVEKRPLGGAYDMPQFELPFTIEVSEIANYDALAKIQNNG